MSTDKDAPGKGTTSVRNLRPFESVILAGVARDLSQLRDDTLMTTRQVAKGVGWSNHNEVARYEHAAPRECPISCVSTPIVATISCGGGVHNGCEHQPRSD